MQELAQAWVPIFVTSIQHRTESSKEKPWVRKRKKRHSDRKKMRKITSEFISALSKTTRCQVNNAKIS